MPSNRSERSLQAIPFGHLIGAPLVAAIEAQAQAAQTTVNFIESVGFKKNQNGGSPGANTDAGDVRMVGFNYQKTNPDGTAANATLNVPVLSIVPVPYMRIEETTIDFTAKIVDIEETQVSTALNTGAEVNGSYGNFLSPVKVGFKASVSYNRNTNSNSRFEKEYQMHVTVRAVQDDMPAGLSKVLNVLENLITEKQPAQAPSK
ncbi:DUF2589 domain-containing protein [Cytobacillus depressus]|uniref:DUF2589 domain-containing protein n=1 Tax=Cytobacillus depressus TaxID=1602942 RepID=A0A6L3UZ60_9BACI|nr:DUF2589 domain-containing protein [Cytobacillus depressus]KAB2329594.1 DUF2589 domain-containing protein [Cytobacillus depressus]